MTRTKKRLILLTAILMMALGLRVSAAIVWQRQLGSTEAFGLPDSHSYWWLGQQIASGHSYEYGGSDYRVFRAPGYPVFLAGLFSTLGRDIPVLWVRWAGAVFGTLAVWGVIWLGRELFDEETGWIAGLLAAVYPGAIGMSVFVLAESLFCPLMIGHLISWVKAWRSDSVRAGIHWSLAGGVAAGLATLVRPSWLLFIPFVLAVSLFLPARRRQLLIGLGMLIALCITMSPWWIRNQLAVGTFVPTTLQVGASLYDGLNERATGASDMYFSDTFYLDQKREDALANRSPAGFEVRLDRRLRDAAIAWAGQNPGRVLQLMGQKFVRMWNVWPNAQEFRSWKMRGVVVVGYVPLLLLGMIGACIWARRGWPYLVCVMPAVYFTSLHLVFVSSVRYRQPAMIVWIVLAAAVIARGRVSVSGMKS